MARAYVSGEYNISIIYGEKCIEMFPEKPDLLSILSECYRYLGDKEKSISYARKCLSKDEYNFDAIRILININYELKKFEEVEFYVNALLDNANYFSSSINLSEFNMGNKITHRLKEIYKEENDELEVLFLWARKFKEWYKNSMEGNCPKLPTKH
jgi:tetratricopeptide (TPR) repeat protein